MNKLAKIPSIQDLYSEQIQLVERTQLNVLLNQEPKQTWLKDHPYVKIKGAPIKYIPIERIEFLLSAIFLKWRVEIKWTKLVANSVEVAIKLWVLDPLTGEWDWQDGLAAVPLQTEKGAGAIEFNKLNSAAVQLALPAAESYAVKDAAEKFGKIFGKDIGRRDEISYDSLMNAVDTTPKEIIDQVNACTNISDVREVYNKYRSEYPGTGFADMVKEKMKEFQK